MLRKNICGMRLSTTFFRRLRKFFPSLFNELPVLRVVKFYGVNFFAEFPCDDSAAASDGQLVAKWLFTPLQNNVPKVLKCSWDKNDENWLSDIEAFKAAFASASSPANFVVVISFPLSFPASVVPFVLTNELTREQLALKRINNSHRFLLIRCPIVRNASKWTKWEKETIDCDFVISGTLLTFEFIIGAFIAKFNTNGSINKKKEAVKVAFVEACKHFIGNYKVLKENKKERKNVAYLSEAFANFAKLWDLARDFGLDFAQICAEGKKYEQKYVNGVPIYRNFEYVFAKWADINQIAVDKANKQISEQSLEFTFGPIFWHYKNKIHDPMAKKHSKVLEEVPDPCEDAKLKVKKTN